MSDIDESDLSRFRAKFPQRPEQASQVIGSASEIIPSSDIGKSQQPHRQKKGTRPTVQFNVRIDPSIRAWISEEAKIEGLTLAEYLTAAAHALAVSRGRSKT